MDNIGAAEAKFVQSSRYYWVENLTGKLDEERPHGVIHGTMHAGKAMIQYRCNGNEYQQVPT